MQEDELARMPSEAEEQSKLNLLCRWKWRKANPRGQASSSKNPESKSNIKITI